MQITAPIEVLDATSVAHSFTPRSLAAERTLLVNRGTSALADEKVTLEFSPSSTKRVTTRVGISFEMPVMDTTAAAPTVIGKALFKGYFVIPDALTASQRADFHSLVANMLDNSIIAAYVKDLDPIWG